MIVFPNGKINLGLSILNKREDGFHDIESIVYPAPMFDIIEFKVSKGLELEVFGMEIPGELSDNLLFKAWQILHQKHGISPISIKLLKGIPTGSGLGGGSANAAFLLKTLNSYFKLNLPMDKLRDYAALLGSDCPFFIKNKPAIIRGRGEIVEQLDLSLKGFHIAIVISDIQISTKEAFESIEPKKYELNLREIIKTPIEHWQGQLVNDFEKITFAKYPTLKIIKDRMLKEGAVYASLTGSGGGVFGIFNKIRNLEKYFPDLIVCKGVLN